MLLVQARERTEPGHGLVDAFAAPPPIREPQRVIRMMRTCRPCSVHEGIMKVLLDVINDLGNVHCRNVGMQSPTCGRFDDCFVMASADGGLDVRAQQLNDAGLIVGGHSARRFSALALYCARLTGRHALFHDQMIAAEQAATERTQAPSGRGRFAATCQTPEFEWNGEHLSALLSEGSPEFDPAARGRISEDCVNYLGAGLYAAAHENSNFSGLHSPAAELTARHDLTPPRSRALVAAIEVHPAKQRAEPRVAANAVVERHRRQVSHDGVACVDRLVEPLEG